MKKHKEEAWETPSLEWIHRVRREGQARRVTKPLSPMSRDEAEKLARRYGLRLVRYLRVGRNPV
jgi:hypothetical protein